MNLQTKYSLNFSDDGLCHRAGAFDISASLGSVSSSFSVLTLIYRYFCRTNASVTPLHLRKTSTHLLQKGRYFSISEYAKLEE